MPNGDYANTRYSELAQINKDNVKNLQVAWTFSTGVLRGHEGGPLVIGNMMYVHTPFPNIVYAIDLNDPGKRVVWKYEPKQDPNVIPVMCCDTVNRGVAYGEGKISCTRPTPRWWRSTPRAARRSGRSRPTTRRRAPPAPPRRSTTMARSMSACRAASSACAAGSRPITRPTVSRPGAAIAGPDSDIAARPAEDNLARQAGRTDSSMNTWQGDQWKIGGGTTWGWISVDPELNLVYYGSGNPSTWNPTQRPGDNRWSMTVFARDANTGMAKWVYQMTPHDEWDYDGVNEMILVDKEIKGQQKAARPFRS